LKVPRVLIESCPGRDLHLRSLAPHHLKLGARYYNPTTARFTQPDPSGQETNTYNYAACNPVNSTDPTGLVSWGCFEGWFGLGFGVTAFGAGVLAAPLSFGGTLLLAGTGAGTLFAAKDIIANQCF
jgi:uncharacterized protein RhaS with RHS repeats